MVSEMAEVEVIEQDVEKEEVDRLIEDEEQVDPALVKIEIKEEMGPKGRQSKEEDMISANMKAASD